MSILDEHRPDSRRKRNGFAMGLMDGRNWQSDLTDSQRTCLRMVGSGMSSKEIAQKTGLSPRTVDQYVNRAAAVLGATNRREAARKLADLESIGLNKLQLQSPPIAEPEKSASVSLVINAPQQARQTLKWLRWFPALGGERHDLSVSAKVQEIIKAAVISAVGFGSIVAIGAWLQFLFS